MRFNIQGILLALSVLSAVVAGVFYLTTPESSTQTRQEAGNSRSTPPIQRANVAQTGVESITPEPVVGVPAIESHAGASIAPQVSSNNQARRPLPAISPKPQQAVPVSGTRILVEVSSPEGTNPFSRGIEITVPEGGRLPMVLAEAGSGSSEVKISAAQREIIDSLSAKFASEISKAYLENKSTGAPADDYGVLWRDAVNSTDDKLRALLGLEAYLKWSIEHHVQNLQAQP